MGKAGYSDLLIMMQNHLSSIIFEAGTVLWHMTALNDFGRILQLRFLHINKVYMATLDPYSTKPYPSCGDFHSTLFTYLLYLNFLCIFIAFTQKNY